MIAWLRAKLLGGDVEEPRTAEERFALRLRSAWQEAARRTNVKPTEERGAGPSNLRFRGRLVRIEVELTTDPIGGRPGTLLMVRDSGEGSQELTIQPQERAAAPGGWLKRREIEVGDPAFDASFSIEGNPLLAQARLDVHTRRRLASLLNGQMPGQKGAHPALEASFTRGVLSIFVPQAPDAPQEELERTVTELLELALGLVHSLAMGVDLSSRLASRFAEAGSPTEPAAGVRRLSLRMLLREFPDHIATQRALRAAHSDPDAEVRLEAAIHQGTRGRETILASIPNAEISDDCAARAVQALGDGLPVELAVKTLRQALTTGRLALARAILAAPGCARTECEGLLLEALASPDAGVAEAAALALGKAGTVAAVPALRELRERGDPELRHVYRQAIAEIQSRLVGADHGQISLATGEGGGLALVPERDEAGRLSVAEASAAPQLRPEEP